MNIQANPVENNLCNSQAHILIEIERLVQTIASGSKQSDNPGFALQLMYALPAYLSVCLPAYDYTEHINVFWQGCWYAGITPEKPITHKQVVSLIQFIRIEVNSLGFLRKASDRRYQTKEKYNKLQDYARRLHENHSRLLVVRVDLNYSKESQSTLGIDMVYQHLEKLNLALLRNKWVFDNEAKVGYAWRIEQGTSRGYHIHTVYYLLGAKHQKDEYIGHQIGELWRKVTDGMGNFYNCNTKEAKAKYSKMDRLGVGMIHRNDKVACENSINAIGYLADPKKDDQYLRMKPKGRRAFGTGM